MKSHMREIMSFLWEFSVHVYSQLWNFPYFVWHYLKLQENSVKLQIFFSALNQTPRQSRLWRPADCCALMLMVRRYKGILFASMIITNTYKSESSWDLFRSLDQLKIDFVSAWGDFLFVPRGLTPRCPLSVQLKNTPSPWRWWNCPGWAQTETTTWQVEHAETDQTEPRLRWSIHDTRWVIICFCLDYCSSSA